jgi:hypothetical protein
MVPASRYARLGVPLLAGAAGLSLTVLFYFDPSRFHFYPLCIFHQTTGLLCPGCGSLRACHQLLHGNLSAALRLNPLFILGLPALAGFLVIGRFRWAGSDTRGAAARPSVWCWLLPLLLLVLAFAVWRNIPGSPFTVPPA